MLPCACPYTTCIIAESIGAIPNTCCMCRATLWQSHLGWHYAGIPSVQAHVGSKKLGHHANIDLNTAQRASGVCSECTRQSSSFVQNLNPRAVDLIAICLDRLGLARLSVLRTLVDVSPVSPLLAKLPQQHHGSRPAEVRWPCGREERCSLQRRSPCRVSPHMVRQSISV